MRYVVKILDDVQNVNSFKEVDELTLVRGNATRLYFRLMTEQRCGDGVDSTRYIPQYEGSVQVEVQFDNLDDDLVVCRVGTQAFPNDDKSIYYVEILKQDMLAFNAMRVQVIEDGVTRNFIVVTDLATEDTDERRFFT